MGLEFDTVGHELPFFGREKIGCLGVVPQKEVGSKGDGHGTEAFYDEDPAPTLEAGDAVHVGYGECEQTGKGAGDGSGAEEEGLSPQGLFSPVPSGYVERGSGIQAG